MIAILRQGDIILDCLPGSQAPRIAEFAKIMSCITPTWRNTLLKQKNKDFGKDATTGFILQTGLAPGYIDLLANGLFNNFVPILKWIASLP
jgi:saccharopine dehydrogenase-like NADP-dependent oxidoreductase